MSHVNVLLVLGRHSRHRAPDEPEWYTAGPTSQSDTIELRGFHQPSEDREKEEASAAQHEEQRSKQQDSADKLAKVIVMETMEPECAAAEETEHTGDTCAAGESEWTIGRG